MAVLKKTRKKPIGSRWRTVGSHRSSQRPHQIEKPAPCGASCPSGNNVRGAMAVVSQRKKLGLSEEEALDEAWRLITATNPFPAVLGRICPHPCERHCNRNEKDDAVAVAGFERFVGDWGIARKLELQRLSCSNPTSKSVAVVGGGPGGLSCAYQLARRGHSVTVYEAYPDPGGILRYGVPTHRLSKAVLDAEINRLRELDITIHCNVQVGSQISFDHLRRSFQALFVAIGAHRGRRLDVPGEEGSDVFSGIDFLRRTNTNGQQCSGPRVVVVGDGQTATDVARVANRLGRAARDPHFVVTLLRSHTQAEQNLRELAEEGVLVEYEAVPTAILREKNGKIRSLTAQRARLSEPRSDGLRLPIPIEGSSLSISADTVIAAVSQCPDWEGLGLCENSGRLKVDDWGKTPVQGVWSGGDNIMLGIAAESIGQGLNAAVSMDAFLCGRSEPQRNKRQPVSTGRVKLDLYDPKTRSSQHRLTPQESLHNLSAEIEQGITRQQALYEAERCLSCGCCFGCESCWLYCTPGCFSKAPQPSIGEPYFNVSLATCDGCRKCADMCPSGFIEML